MTRFLIITLILILSSNFNFAQNIGQEGDSIVNYTDINGLKQGKWSKKYKNEKVAYTAIFHNDKLIGTYKRFYKIGRPSLLVEYDKEGKEAGYAKLYYDNRKMSAEGNYIKRNIKDGLWKYYGVDGRLVMKIDYAEGVKNGKEITYWSNGIVMQEKNWLNGVEEGYWLQFFENGKERLKAQIKNGKRNGAYYAFYPNGRYYARGRYKDNLKNGHWIFSERNGDTRRDTEFTHGVAADQDEIDKEVTKEIEEYEQMKGLIPDPNIENMYNYNKNYGPISR